MSSSMTDWSIGIVSMVAWVPIYKAIAEVPFRRVSFQEKYFKKYDHPENYHLKWSLLPLFLVLMQMLSTLIYMKLEKCIVHFCKYNLLVYAALVISYVLS